MRVLQRTGLLAAQGPLNFFSQMISLLGDFFRFLASEDSSEFRTLRGSKETDVQNLQCHGFLKLHPTKQNCKNKEVHDFEAPMTPINYQTNEQVIKRERIGIHYQMAIQSTHRHTNVHELDSTMPWQTQDSHFDSDHTPITRTLDTTRDHSAEPDFYFARTTQADSRGQQHSSLRSAGTSTMISSRRSGLTSPQAS